MGAVVTLSNLCWLPYEKQSTQIGKSGLPLAANTFVSDETPFQK